MKKWITILGCLLAFTLSAQNEALFNRATEDYNKGNFESAADKYLEILESGEHSAALYYNLANCYYKLNQIAPSIYYYEKALLLDPNDREIKNNLSYARNMTLDDIEPLPQTGISKIIDDLTSLMTFDQWSYLAVALMLLFVAGSIAYYKLRYSTHKRLAFILSVIFLFLSLSAVLFSYLQYSSFMAEQPAIIFAGEVAVRSEPNTRSQEAFMLHEGTKVLVLEQLNDWKRIQLADGATGWIPQETLKLLKDF